MPSLVRSTKYSTAIVDILCSVAHATNLQLLQEVHAHYPEVSATTIHRLTARLAERGVIGIAPQAKDGSMRYDANTLPHDHFCCSVCGVLSDVYVSDKVIPLLKAEIEGCELDGNLVIQGVCKHCKGGL